MSFFQKVLFIVMRETMTQKPYIFMRDFTYKHVYVLEMFQFQLKFKPGSQEVKFNKFLEFGVKL